MTELAVASTALTKQFGDFTAVSDIDLSIETGQVFALLGPNGSGKTTTVRMLTTLTDPTSGSASIFGHDVVAEADAVRLDIALTGQFAALEDNLSCRDNLVLMARLRGYPAGGARRVAESLIERLEIGEFADKCIKDVSGGQKRRVDLAAGLVVKPRLLVLDEPTTGLDPRSRSAVWSTVADLVALGVTVLLTTQYLEEADALADQIMLIDHGRSIATGSPSELKARIGGQRVDIVASDLAGQQRLDALLSEHFELIPTAMPRTISVPAPNATVDLDAVSAQVRHSGVAVDEIALRRPSLDDAFLALTGTAPESDHEAVAA